MSGGRVPRPRRKASRVPTLLLTGVAYGVALAAAGCRPHDAAPPPRTTSMPACTEIVGPANLALSFDGGKTLVESPSPRVLYDAVAELVPLGRPLQLAALLDHNQHDARWRELFVSSDGGCHWESRGKTLARAMEEGRDGVAYAWGDGLASVTLDGERSLEAPTTGIVGVATDASDARHVRLVSLLDGGASIAVFDSSDQGRSWQRRVAVEATPPFAPILGRVSARLSFDPRDLDRMILTSDDDAGSARMTHDGGRSWSVMAGCDQCFAARIAGADVFGMGPRSSPRLFHSANGGRTFVPVTELQGALSFIRAEPSDRELSVVTSHAVETGDARTAHWRIQEFPLAPPPPPVEDQAARGTFVPGAPGVLCIGIDTWKPLPPMIGN